MTDFDRAVEAMTTLWPKGNPSQIEAQTLLSAALPHLARHFREMMAEELRQENFRLADADPRKHDFGDQMEWRKAADHLEGQ